MLKNIPQALVSPDWLKQHLDEPNLVILDSSMTNPISGELEEVEPSCIKGAQRFDYDTIICDQSSHLPHMMPTPEQFQQQVGELGISQNSVIVVYDNQGIFSSPRAWWMFKSMGHENVAVLDGGFPLWEKLEYPLEKLPVSQPQEGDFRSHFQEGSIFSKDNIMAAIDDQSIQIIDARSAGRFEGTEPEPREGLRGGHIPSSLNFPYTEIVQDGQMVALQELTRLFGSIVTPGETKQVYSCGSGVTACILALGAHLCGYNNMAIYDGSWTEWGAKNGLPIET